MPNTELNVGKINNTSVLNCQKKKSEKLVKLKKFSCMNSPESVAETPLEINLTRH